MSLLMEALKKAERAKQEQTIPSTSQSNQPGGAEKMPSQASASNAGLSPLPREEVAGHVDTTGAGAFPSISTAHETPSLIPDLAPLPAEDGIAISARTEPMTQGLELTLAAYDSARDSARSGSEPPCGEPSPPTEAPVGLTATTAPAAEPEARPQVAASAQPSSGILPARHVEPLHKAPSQDVRTIAAAQQKAKTVFTAKQPARSRTLLLTGIAAAVVFGLVGFGVYYWQITSTSTMVPPASTPQPTDTAAPAIPVEAEAPQQQGAPAAPAQNSIDKSVPSTAEKPAPVSAQASPASAAADPARTDARSGSEPFKDNPAIRIRQSAATSQLNPTLGKAYQSFLSGDTGMAQQLYRKALQQEPNNRDALLGMAATALKQKQAGQAAAYYGKLLELDPADPEALAGLIGLQGQSDPAQSESRLKKVLLQNPQADAAHFALGNLYTQQSRWAEAQQSYFRAYSSAPGNADYAFNLAVSLDHLNQSKLALDYYQRALAQPGPANFDKSSVQIRIKELLQPAGN